MAKFFKKSQSAFALFQEQSDKLIKEINKDLKKCTAELKKKQIDEITRKYLREICLKNLGQIADDKKKLSELKEENEPKPTPKFETKKEERLKKLTNLEVLIKDIHSKLEIEKQSGDQMDAHSDEKQPNLAEKDVSDKDVKGSEEEEDDDDDNDDDVDDDVDDDGETKKATQRKDSLKDLKSPGELQKGDGTIGIDDDEGDDDDDDAREDDDVHDDDDDAEESKPEVSADVSKNNKTFSNKKAEPTRKKSVTLVTDKSDGDDDNDDDDDDDVDDDDDDDDEEEGDAEEEEGNESVELPDGENIFVAIKSFPGQEKGDLAFEKNEKLKIIRIRNDGWMVAVNDKGEEGLVPGNFFEKHSNSKSGTDKDERGDDETEEDDDEDEEDDEEEEEEVGEEMISGHDDDGDVDIESKESKNVQKKKKTKPLNLWSQLRSSASLPEERKAELIRSLSSVPSGYREPTLSQLTSKTKFSLKYHMHPTLSISCLNFKDLAMDVRTNQVEQKKSRIQCILDLISIRNLPLPRDESVIKIVDCHVRICLFDGQNFLSNIVIVKVPSTGDGYRLWKFNKQTSSPSLEFSQIFIRSNSMSSETGVLLEISANLQTEAEKIELSCGWTFFKLFSEDGLPVPNKTYYSPINGGTPFEKGVPVDKESDHVKNRRFSFANVLKSMKDLPVFVLKLRSPKKIQNIHLESLPEVVIGQTCSLFYFFLHRQFLLDALIKYRNDLHSTEVLHSPLLVSLTEMLERPELLDILRESWTEKLKSMTRSEKRNHESVKASFLAVFMENVYPLMFLAKLKGVDHMNTNIWKKQSEEVQTFIKDDSGKQLAGLDLFTKTRASLVPFDTKELIFNLLDSNIVNISLKNKS